jgi:hypothetical protein
MEETMKTMAFLLAFLLVSVPAWVSCKGKSQKAEAPISPSNTGNELLMQDNDKPKMPTRTEIEIAKATAERLLPNFSYSNYEVEGEISEIYENVICSRNQTNINTTIINDTLFEALNFLGTDRTLHDHIYIKIDKKSLTVVGFPTFDSPLTNGLVIEHILFWSNTRGTASRFIAANPGKEVRVRLEGSGGTHDFTLTKDDHVAICQTVELYDALMILKDADIDPLTDLKAKPNSII